MILDVMDAIDLIVTALAVWITIGAALATPIVLATVWAGRALWRRLTGARKPADGLEAPRCPQCAHNAAQAPPSETGYQEAA